MIDAVELRRVALPLVSPFRTSQGTEWVRDALLVHVIGGEAEGWGECVAMSSPLYSDEYVDGAADVLRRFLVPAVLAGQEVDVVRGHPMARAALGTAMLDASLRARGVSLAASLGAVRSAVDVGVSIGIVQPVDALVGAVASYVEQGYRRVKLKVEPGWDVEPVAAVRGCFADLPLQVDANGAYQGRGGEELLALDGFGLVLLEQPLAADDLAGHAALASRMMTPICLDESITSARVARLALELGACSVVNIKPGRVGGIEEAKRIHDVCVAADVPVWCGGMLETGIGRAANLALAALPGFTLPADLSASDRYFRLDITPPFVLEDGQLRVPTGPGIGVSVVPAALEELTTSIEVITT